MLLNLWYVAALERDVLADQPLGVRMLGHDIVLFRDDAGAICALSDVCVHRGASLCRGKVQAGRIACPYHGWQYDSAGRCVLIPSLGEGAAIPKRARVDAYPVAIKYGLVWVFIGDMPESKRPPIPTTFEPYWASDAWRCISGKFLFKANWQRLVENGLDTAHVHFVHPAFGNPNAARVEPAAIEEHAYGAKTAHSFTAASIENKSGASRAALEEAGRAAAGSRRPSSELQFHLSGLTIQILQTMAPGIAQCILSCDTPIDAYTTMAFWVQARSYKREPEHDADRAAMVTKVYEQDYSVVGPARPAFVPDRELDELTVAADAMPMKFRQKLDAWRAAGHWFDLQAEQSGDSSVRVLPSAARSADADGWVLRPVTQESR
jgi:phenylpropionate dioxygenase-like ring-hydroxylating dioxygenase large terminal subunit